MSKQPGSTLVTTINGSRSCYITTNRFAFFSVETILTGTIHISNDILNGFWVLFKNVNPSTKRQEKRFSLTFKRSLPHLAHRRALRALMITSAERFKGIFVHAKFTQTICIWTKNTSAMRKKVLLQYPQSGVNSLHIVIDLKYVTLVSNKKSILVEMFDFAIT